MTASGDMTVGVVGLDEMGRLYAEEVQQLGYTVIGADTNAQFRSEFEGRLGVDTYADHQALFEHELDFVIVTVPNKFKEPIGRDALDAGYDVYFEKPLAHTAESARRIARYAAGTDRICMVGYYHLFLEPVEALATYLDRGDIGTITHIDCKFTHKRHVPNRGSWYTSNDIAGGGVLQDKGSFALSILQYLGFGAIEEVAAVARSEFDHREDYVYVEMWGGEGHENVIDVEDSLVALVTFESGATASIDLTWALNNDAHHEYRFRGPDGGARLSVRHPGLTLFDADQGPPQHLRRQQLDFGGLREYQQDGEIHDPLLQRKQLRRYVECLENRTPPERGSLEDAVAIQRNIERIYDATDPL
jgi:predicted dehydrogenase